MATELPLPENIRTFVGDYCARDLPGATSWYVNQFFFIEDVQLRARLGRAYYTARYISKLLEGLYLSGEEAHPLIKFQVIQYASIYEAVISFLLWNRYAAHPDVLRLETHKALVRMPAFAQATSLKYGEEELCGCVERKRKTPRSSIPFKDKVDCAVSIGFVDQKYADDIKQIYALRNLAHIENEADKAIELELSNARTGYWRMKPFLETIASKTTESSLADLT